MTQHRDPRRHRSAGARPGAAIRARRRARRRRLARSGSRPCDGCRLGRSPGSIDVGRATRRRSAQSDVVVLAVPFGSVDALLEELRPQLQARHGGDRRHRAGDVRRRQDGDARGCGRIRIGARPRAAAGRASGWRRRSRRFRRICSATGTTPLDCDEFVCGDSDEARAERSQLVELLPGLRPVDVGPLSRARSIEHLTALAIAINRRHKIHDARFRIVGLR